MPSRAREPIPRFVTILPTNSGLVQAARAAARITSLRAGCVPRQCLEARPQGRDSRADRLADRMPRRPTQAGSLKLSLTVPSASCQTSAFSGRSMPDVCAACISGVPAAGLPNTSSVVGRSSSPTPEAPAA
jgi:hypothetical protein